MSTVRIDLRQPAATGEVPAALYVQCRPTARQDFADHVTLPRPFSAALDEGVVTVELAATGAGWCWEVSEQIVRYVAVPESAEVLEYSALIDVDPATLTPVGDPPADVWALALSEAVEDATTDAAASALAASGSASTATTQAGIATTQAQAAAVSAAAAAGTSDAGIAAIVNNPASASRAALSATFGRRLMATDFGVAGDGRHANDAVVTAGALTVTSATIGFTPSDVGKTLMTVTDYNSGWANSRALGAAITAGTAFGAVTSITLASGLTNSVADRSPVWLIAYGRRYTAEVSGAHSAGATSIAVTGWAVDLYGVSTFFGGVPASGTKNAGWVMFPASTTVIGTIASVEGTTATVSGTPAAASATGVTVFVGTDDTTAMRAAIAAAEQSYASTPASPAGKGALIELPRGITVITGALEIGGARQYANVFAGGVGIKGQGKRASTLVCASLTQSGIAFGAANTTAGSTSQTVSDVTLADIAIQGPGMMHRGTVGIDKRASGGGYRYSSILLDGFDIAIRHHDMYALVADAVETHRSWIGRAIGFQGDIQQWNSPYANHCGIDLYLGYADPARAQTRGSNGWRAHAEVGAVATGCMVNVFVEGYSTQGSFTTIERHNEYFADVAYRFGDGELAAYTLGHIQISGGGCNAPRPAADIFGPAGRVKHAYEINKAYSVEIAGGYVAQTADAPIRIRENTANVRAQIASTYYNSADAVPGDVLCPDGTTYRYCAPPSASPNVGSAAQKVAFTWGRWGGDTVPLVHALPGATQLSSGAWLGRTLMLLSDGVQYRCETVSGSPAWVALPSATAISAASAVTDRTSANAQELAANTAVETTLVTHTIPAGTVSDGTTYRLRVGGSVDNIATSGALTFKVRLGGTTRLTFSANSVGSASTTGRWVLDCDLTFRGAASSATPAAVGALTLKLGGTVYPLVDSSVSSSLSMTSAQTVTVSATWATADPGNVVRREVAAVNRII